MEDVLLGVLYTYLIPGSGELRVDRQERHCLSVTHQRVITLC